MNIAHKGLPMALHKQRKLSVNLDAVITHIEHLNPANVFWDNYAFREIRERSDNGHVTLKNYHGFDVGEHPFDLKNGGARIVLIHNGRVVLQLAYTNDCVPLQGRTETVRDISVEVYAKGAWEAALNKIIKVGSDNAIRSYVDPFLEEIEKQFASYQYK